MRRFVACLALLLFLSPCWADERAFDLPTLKEGEKSTPAEEQQPHQGKSLEPSIEDIEYYTKAIEQDPKNAYAYFRRGAGYLLLEKYEPGIADLSKALDLCSDSRRTFMGACLKLRAMAYAFSGHYQLAIKDCTDALGLYQRRLEDYSRDYILESQDPKHKELLLLSIRHIENDVHDVYVRRGQVYCLLKKYQLAMEDFNKAILLNQESYEAYSYRGVVYIKIGRYQLAAEDLKKSLEINPRNADSFNFLGELYRNLRDYEKAIQNYQKAIQIDPRHCAAYYNLGLTYYILDKPYLSVRSYLMGFLKDNNALNALKGLSIIDILSGRF
jgi:tetratricopeptide (TPR) repeat protein